jgi:hypothetical protein
MAEVVEMQYLFQRPLLVDSSQAERAFGLRPTPLGDVLAETVRGAA